jgi:hypothetical protein
MRQPSVCCLVRQLGLHLMPRRSLSSRSSPSAKSAWQTQCVPLTRWCWMCMRTFSTASNLRRHQNQQVTPCSPSENVSTRQVQDQATGRLRFRTRQERLERDRNRKREEYWRFLIGLVSISPHSLANLLISALFTSTQEYKQHRSRLYQRAKASRQGGTTPTSPKLEDRQRKWTWLLQQVKTTWCAEKIEEYARLLAAYHSVGDSNVPTWVHQVYQAMDV